MFARPLARLEGIEIEAWKTDFPSHLLEGLFNFTIAGLVRGLNGLTLAALTHSAAMAIGIGIGFLLVVEGLIRSSRPTSSLPPGKTLRTLAAGGDDQLAWAPHSASSCSTASSPPPRRSRWSAPETSSPDLGPQALVRVSGRTAARRGGPVVARPLSRLPPRCARATEDRRNEPVVAPYVPRLAPNPRDSAESDVSRRHPYSAVLRPFAALQAGGRRLGRRKPTRHAAFMPQTRPEDPSYAMRGKLA